MKLAAHDVYAILLTS